MTKRDFILIAEALRNAKPPIVDLDARSQYVAWFATVCSVAAKLSKDNARFDCVRFLSACGQDGATLPEGSVR